jgi:hypothetical protein
MATDHRGMISGLQQLVESARTITWSSLLDTAATPEEVLAVTKDFLAMWEPLELSRLPDPCKPPPRFREPEDVVNYAFALVQHHCGPGAGNADVHRLATFFSAAARQMAILMSNVPSRPAEND